MPQQENASQSIISTRWWQKARAARNGVAGGPGLLITPPAGTIPVWGTPIASLISPDKPFFQDVTTAISHAGTEGEGLVRKVVLTDNGRDSDE